MHTKDQSRNTNLRIERLVPNQGGNRLRDLSCLRSRTETEDARNQTAACPTDSERALPGATNPARSRSSRFA
jgi:hypothetical protein